jgi:acyl carrier protein
MELMGIDRVGVNDSFFDLGGDSLVAIQLITTINKVTGAGVTVAQLYGTLTIARLAALIEGHDTGSPDSSGHSLDEVKNRASSRRQHQQHRLARSRARRQASGREPA